MNKNKEQENSTEGLSGIGKGIMGLIGTVPVNIAPPSYASVYSNVSHLSSRGSSYSSTDSASTASTSPISTRSMIKSSMILSPSQSSMSSTSTGDSYFDKDPYSFLTSVFAPACPILSAPYSVEAFEDEELDPIWSGVAVNNPEEAIKTVYVKFNSSLDEVDLKESVMGLIDVADNQECTGLVICLDKSSADLNELVHSLMYVGGTIVPPNLQSMTYRPQYVLVGIDL